MIDYRVGICHKIPKIIFMSLGIIMGVERLIKKVKNKFNKFNSIKAFKYRHITNLKRKLFGIEYKSMNNCSRLIPNKNDELVVFDNKIMNRTCCKNIMCSKCHSIVLFNHYKKFKGVLKEFKREKFKIYMFTFQTPTINEKSISHYENTLVNYNLSKNTFNKFMKYKNHILDYKSKNELHILWKHEFDMNKNYQFNFHFHGFLCNETGLSENNIQTLKEKWLTILKKEISKLGKSSLKIDEMFHIKEVDYNTIDEGVAYLNKNSVSSVVAFIKDKYSLNTKNKNYQFEIIDDIICDILMGNKVNLIKDFDLDKEKLLESYKSLLDVTYQNKGESFFGYPYKNNLPKNVVKALDQKYFNKDKGLYFIEIFDVSKHNDNLSVVSKFKTKFEDIIESTINDKRIKTVNLTKYILSRLVDHSSKLKVQSSFSIKSLSSYSNYLNRSEYDKLMDGLILDLSNIPNNHKIFEKSKVFNNRFHNKIINTISSKKNIKFIDQYVFSKDLLKRFNESNISEYIFKILSLETYEDSAKMIQKINKFLSHKTLNVDKKSINQSKNKILNFLSQRYFSNPKSVDEYKLFLLEKKDKYYKDIDNLKFAI